MKTVVTPIADRFWAKVRKTDDCWEWTGGHYRSGYGCIARERPYARSKSEYAHRVSWLLHFGPISDPVLHVLHRCDNRNCVNPAHLFLGTEGDNARDKRDKGRAAKKLTAEDVRWMRFARAYSGAGFVALGAAFGIGDSQAANIIKRRQWCHV